MALNKLLAGDAEFDRQLAEAVEFAADDIGGWEMLVKLINDCQTVYGMTKIVPLMTHRELHAAMRLAALAARLVTGKILERPI